MSILVRVAACRGFSTVFSISESRKHVFWLDVQEEMSVSGSEPAPESFDIQLFAKDSDASERERSKTGSSSGRPLCCG